MVSSARQVITSLLLALGIAACVQAQTNPQKVASASVSGKVIIKGKPALGVMVAAKEVPSYNDVVRYRARTDRAGNYRIADLPAGTYEIFAVAPAFVVGNQSGSVAVSEGEEVEDVNLSLALGGIITGKITDADGEPLIGQPVNITRLYVPYPRPFSTTLAQKVSDDYRTDDRGVYRAFGLPPGKYRVSVGEFAAGQKSSREYNKETFYSLVTDAPKATVLEVTEGSETNNIDIVLGRTIKTFKVTVRVVDRETGKPIPNVGYGQSGGGSTMTYGSKVTNAEGEFRLENLSPGKYTAFIDPGHSGISPASVSFAVVDRDLTDLLIKTSKGSSLSGVVIIEGNQRAANVLRHWLISAAVRVPNMPTINPPYGRIGEDGTFKINGVRSGLVHLSIFGDRYAQCEILRVEHSSSVQPETITVKEGEQLTGIRIIVKYLKKTGAIRGQVKVENGELPPISELRFLLWQLDENLQPKPTSSILPPQLDARGHFYAEGLPAGTYGLRVSVVKPGQTGMSAVTTQQVTVADDTVTEVTLILPQPKSQPN
jgi:hypothetical protein